MVMELSLRITSLGALIGLVYNAVLAEIQAQGALLSALINNIHWPQLGVLFFIVRGRACEDPVKHRITRSHETRVSEMIRT